MSSERTILALRLDDPGDLFSSESPISVETRQSILNAHFDIVVHAPAVRESTVRDPDFANDLPSQEEIADTDSIDALRGLSSSSFKLVFDTETEALRAAVAIQQQTAESLDGRRAGDEEARLQCAIVLAHGDLPTAPIKVFVSGVASSVASRARQLLQREPSSRTSDVDTPPDTTEAVKMLKSKDVVSGGQIVCSGAVYQNIFSTKMHKLFSWQEVSESAQSLTWAYIPTYINDQIRRSRHNVTRFAKGLPAPMECIYDDAQVLLNAPFERTFSEEVKGWIQPRRGEEQTLPYPERPHVDNDLVGLALSGGGMRSAVFSLGAVQALARYGVLKDVDYLSTVSGGGYFGASLSALWADPLPYDDLTQLDATPEKFPFAHPRPPSGGETRAVHGNESPALKHVRGHSKLLGRGIGLFDAETWSTTGQFLVSAMLLWAIFLLPVITLAVLAGLGVREGFEEMRPHVDWRDPMWITMAISPAVLAILALFFSSLASFAGDRVKWLLPASISFATIAAGLFVIAVFGIVTVQDSMNDVWTNRWPATMAALSPLALFGAYAVISLFVEGATGRNATHIPHTVRSVLLPITAVLTLVLLVSAGVWGFEKLWSGDVGKIIAAGTGVGGATIAGISLSKLRDARLQENKRIQRAALQIGVAAGGYVVLGLALCSWAWFLLSISDTHPGWVFGLGASVAGFFVAVTSFMHPLSRSLLNGLSLNRAYTARVQKTWIVGAVPPDSTDESDATDKAATTDATDDAKAAHWAKVWPRPDITMKTLRNEKDREKAASEQTATDKNACAETAKRKSPPAGPYQLICTAVSLPGSTSAKLLDRKADSFVIAPICSGSALTRWIPTKDHDELDDMGLAEATAISGAAVSPNMGKGTTRTLSIILTLLNVRLGRWLRNPRPSTNTLVKKLFADAPLVLYWKEMFGLATHDDGQIYLSDGGHFENLGLYELLRRRCKYIVAISADNGALDEAFDMGNLGRALRLARVDFGVEVDMGPLSPLMHNLKSGEVGSFFAAGEITYPSSHPRDELDESEKGTLIFIKSGIIEKKLTPDLLRHWKQDNPAFPYDTTGDQQFDQPQFESYRQLGYIAARAMWKSADSACSTNDTRKRLQAIADKYRGPGKQRTGLIRRISSALPWTRTC